jgi:hypothetical protein
MDKEQGTQQEQVDPFRAWADRLALEANLHQQTAIEVQQLDAEALKRGLSELLAQRGELLQQLRDGLVTQHEMGLLVIAQLASSGGMTQLVAVRELLGAVRGLSAIKAPPQSRVSLS